MAHGYCGDRIGEHHRKEFVNEIETLGRRLDALKHDFSVVLRREDAKRTFERSIKLLPNPEVSGQKSEVSELKESDELGGS